MYISLLHTTSLNVKRINNVNSKRKMQEKMEGFGFALTKEVVERNYLKMLRFTPSFLFLTYALNIPTTSDIALNYA